MIPYIKLFELNGTFWVISANENDRIDAAVTRFLSSTGVEELLLLETPEGAQIRIRASSISSWILLTVEAQRARKAWQDEVRREPWEDSDGSWEDSDG